MIIEVITIILRPTFPFLRDGLVPFFTSLKKHLSGNSAIPIIIRPTANTIDTPNYECYPSVFADIIGHHTSYK
jgi:hypothetical protein